MSHAFQKKGRSCNTACTGYKDWNDQYIREATKALTLTGDDRAEPRDPARAGFDRGARSGSTLGIAKWARAPAGKAIGSPRCATIVLTTTSRYRFRNGSRCSRRHFTSRTDKPPIPFPASRALFTYRAR
jgi:hypothetical protein